LNPLINNGYRDYNKTMRLKGHNIVQTHHVYRSYIKVIDDEVNNYNQWLHINDIAKDLILTSLAPKIYVKLQNFMVTSDMLKYLEAKFGE
jgi:hypothetical protein